MLYNKDNDVDEWFERFELISRPYEWDDQTKADLIPTYLGGEAKQIFKSLSKEHQSDYKKLKRKLLQKLSNASSKEVFGQYINLAQGPDETVGQLLIRLKEMVSKSKEVAREPDKSIAKTFIKALRREIGANLLPLKFKDLAHAVKSAEEIESFLKKKNKEDIYEINAIQSPSGYSQQQNGQSNMQSYQQQQPHGQYPQQQYQQHCSQQQYPQQQYPQQPYQQPQRQRQGYRVGQYQQQRGQQSQQHGYQQKHKYACIACKMFDHRLRECPQVDWSKYENMKCHYCQELGHPIGLCLKNYFDNLGKGSASRQETAKPDGMSPTQQA